MARIFFCAGTLRMAGGIAAGGWVGGNSKRTGGGSMAFHPCPRCKRLIPVGMVYCPTCKPIADAQAAEAIARRQEYKRKKYDKEYNRKRDPKYLAFYRSKEWRLLSRTKLQDCGYKCEAKLDGCKGLAVEVHHVKPIKTDEGWELRLDWDNLMGVCIACHNVLDGKNFKRKSETGVIDLRTLDPRGGSKSF